MVAWRGITYKVIAICALVFALPTSAVEYGGIGGKPAYPQANNPRTESIFVHTLEPGTTQNEGVLVSNSSAEEQVLEVYAVDSVGSTDGAFACAQASDEKIDVGTWITLEQTDVTLDAGNQQTIPFTIAVPETADVGEHNGCIVIQKKGVADSNNSGMNLSFRSAIRVAVTVPGDIVRSLEIKDLTYTPPSAETLPTINLSVANNGNVSIDAATEALTKNIFGKTYFTHGGTYPVLRADSAQWHYELPNSFWGGWFQTTATVTYDANTEASLGQDSGLEKTVLTTSTDWFFLAPSTKGLVIEVVLVLTIPLIIIVLLWLRKKRNKEIQQWKTYTVKKRDDLEALAKHHNIVWKRLAKMNRLKAPYRLKAGDTIMLPPSPHGETSKKSKEKL